MRKVYISLRERPSEMTDDNTVWLTVKPGEDVYEYMKIAVRMRPDEIIITSDAFHLLMVSR